MDEDKTWISAVKLFNAKSRAEYKPEAEKCGAKFWVPYSVSRYLSSDITAKRDKLMPLVTCPEMENFWINFRKQLFGEIHDRNVDKIKAEYQDDWEEVLESELHQKLNSLSLELMKTIATVLPPIESPWLLMNKAARTDKIENVLRNIRTLKLSLQEIGFQAGMDIDPFKDEMFKSGVNQNVFELLSQLEECFRLKEINNGLVTKTGQKTAERLALIRVLSLFFKGIFPTSKNEWIAVIASAVTGEAISSDTVKSSLRPWKHKSITKVRLSGGT